MAEKVDIFSIEKMCKKLATDGDYKTLAHLVRVNRMVHDTCQKYLDRVKKERQQRERDMRAIDQGHYELRLYPSVDPKMTETENEVHEELDETLKRRYGPTIYLDGVFDESGIFCFEVVDWGETELEEMTTDFQQNGYMMYNKIRYDLAYVVEGRKIITYDEILEENLDL